MSLVHFAFFSWWHYAVVGLPAGLIVLFMAPRDLPMEECPAGTWKDVFTLPKTIASITRRLIGGTILWPLTYAFLVVVALVAISIPYWSRPSKTIHP